MKAYDFSYDGKKLSSFGMILCSFDGSEGFDNISDGSQITFNTVSTLGGTKHKLGSTQYDECLSATFQICKHSCSDGVQEITATEHREITSWLNRKKFLKFKILDEDHIDLYYEGSFNINKIEMDGRLIGFELNLITNRPFALKDLRTIIIKNTELNGKYSLNDTSYEEGHIYPYTEITIGNIDDLPNEEKYLKIYNAMEDRETYITGVSSGEVITMDYPIITSSLHSHNIQNDFNWCFFRVANTYENSRNDLTISIPCTIKVKYSPIVKVGL